MIQPRQHNNWDRKDKQGEGRGMHEHSAAWMPLLKMDHKQGETNNQSINQSIMRLLFIKH